MSPTRRVTLLVAGVAALAVAALLLPLEAVPAALTRLGPAAPVAGVLLGVVLLAALVPRTPISVACGLLFGAMLGPICALAVMVVAAAVTFVAGRLLGRAFARRLAGRRIGRAWTSLDRWVSREGLIAVAAVRSLPLAPYGLVGYAYGASAVRVRDYLAGSVLAGSPSAVSYALLGAAVGGIGGGATPLTIVPVLVGTALTGVVVTRTVLRLRATRRLQDDADHPAGDHDDLLRGPALQGPGHLGQRG